MVYKKKFPQGCLAITLAKGLLCRESVKHLNQYFFEVNISINTLFIRLLALRVSHGKQ